MARARQGYFQRAHVEDDKRTRTRALILDSAIAIFAEKGIGQSSVAEIAAKAGLSNGAFYYHFEDKTALLKAVGRAVAATLVANVDEAIEGVRLGPERVAAATILFIRRGASDPSWGPLIVQALNEMGEFRDKISVGIRKDIRIGIDQGQFGVAFSEDLVDVLLGIVATALRVRIERQGGDDVTLLAAASILKVLGLAARRAETIAARMNERGFP